MNDRLLRLFDNDERCTLDGQDFGLSCQAVNWTCRDGELNLRIVSLETLELPSSEASEPRAAALARIAQHVRAHQAYLIIEQISDIDEAFYTHLSACRFVRIHNDSDREIWDRLLSMGLPIYGLSESIYCDVSNPLPASLLSALLFGAYYCSDGLLLSIDEGPQHCFITSEESLTAQVIIRGGMEAQQLNGTEIKWQDSGQEGYVRFELRGESGQAWTQPRFVSVVEAP